MNVAWRANLRVASVVLLLGCGALACQGDPVLIDVHYPPTAESPVEGGAGGGSAGVAGSIVAGTGGSGMPVPQQSCMLPAWYGGAEMLVRNNCRIKVEDEWLRQLIEAFLNMSDAQAKAEGETRTFDFCDSDDADRLWFVNDPLDPTGATLKLCEARCDFLARQVEDEYRFYAGCMAANAER